MSKPSPRKIAHKFLSQTASAKSASQLGNLDAVKVSTFMSYWVYVGKKEMSILLKENPNQFEAARDVLDQISRVVAVETGKPFNWYKNTMMSIYKKPSRYSTNIDPYGVDGIEVKLPYGVKIEISYYRWQISSYDITTTLLEGEFQNLGEALEGLASILKYVNPNSSKKKQDKVKLLRQIQASMLSWLEVANKKYRGLGVYNKVKIDGDIVEGKLRGLGNWDLDEDDYEAMEDPDPDFFIMDYDDKERIDKDFKSYMKGEDWYSPRYELIFSTGEKRWSYFYVRV